MPAREGVVQAVRTADFQKPGPAGSTLTANLGNSGAQALWPSVEGRSGRAASAASLRQGRWATARVGLLQGRQHQSCPCPHKCVHACVGTCMCMCRHMCAHVCTCTGAHVGTCMCVGTCVCTHVSAWMWVHVCTCVRVGTCVCECRCMCTCMCVHACKWVHVCARMCASNTPVNIYVLG